MKATLVFSLPKEKAEFDTAMNAGKYKCVLSEFNEAIRQRWKYSELTEEARKECEEIRQLWLEAVQEIDFD